MKIKVLPDFHNNYYGVMDKSGYIYFNMDKVYDVIQIVNGGFLVCHDGYFVVVPFERAKRVTKLEGVLE